MSNPNQNEYLRQMRTQDFVEDKIDLREYLGVILEARWFVLGITAAIFSIGLLYIVAATPIYRSDALLQVEDSKPTLSGLDDITSAFSTESPSITEIEIIRSRSIIGAAIDKLGLTIKARPVYFPMFGASSARRFSHENTLKKLAKPVWGLDSYAWGGERLSVQRLDVPRELEGEDLTLVAGTEGKYKLYGPDGELLVSGEINKLSSGKTEDKQQVDVFITDIFARNGTHFNLVSYSRAKMIEKLQEDLSIQENGKKSGILQIALEGNDPVLISKILDAIANTYLRQNAERKSIEAERTLQFLNTQLPQLKGTLDEAETNLNNYRAKSGKIDLTLETQGILDQSADIEKNIQKLQLEKTKLQQRFTSSHPSILGIDKQISDLRADRARLDKEIKSLPATEQESVKLTRNVKVANELYLLLLNKSQELKVVKAGTVGNVRILDTAIVPEKPIKPKKLLTLLLSLIGGILLAVFTALVRKNLFQGLEDPNEIENRFGIPVYASILHSDTQTKLEREIRRAKLGRLPILVEEERESLTIEALRSLRTSLQFALMKSKNNVVAFSGPSPEIGKSFISVNYSHVLADIGKNILLIDGDMRKGHLHKYYSRNREEGLSEVLSGTLELNKAIYRTSYSNISLLAAGIIPPNPSELLTDIKFADLIDDVSKKYDIVIIDTPPILAATDAVIISRFAGILFLILEARKHHIGEIEYTLKRLGQIDIQPQGIILNNVKLSTSKYGYSYQYKY